MKQKHMFALLDQTFTTVRASFNAAPPEPVYRTGQRYEQQVLGHDVPQTPPEPCYTYKVPKAWELKQGDLILVETHRGITVVYVREVHTTPQIDFDADFDYKWAIQRVDMTEYDSLIAREKSFHEAMLEIEREKQRASIVLNFRNSLVEGSAARKLFDQTTASLAPSTPPSYDDTAPKSFGDGPTHADDGHAGFTPPAMEG